jgi:hypothetical protein
MSNMIFIFTPKKLKRKIFFVALRINKKFTFYCDKLSIETKKSQLHTLQHSTHFRYMIGKRFIRKRKNLKKQSSLRNLIIQSDVSANLFLC